MSVVHRTPTCGCCKDYEAYLRRHGYSVESVVADDLAPVRAEHGIPETAASCHTTVIGGYAVEGHVPVAEVERMLAERPAIAGIAVPGMPIGSPGMEVEGSAPQPYEVIAFTAAGEMAVYASYP